LKLRSFGDIPPAVGAFEIDGRQNRVPGCMTSCRWPAVRRDDNKSIAGVSFQPV